MLRLAVRNVTSPIQSFILYEKSLTRLRSLNFKKIDQLMMLIVHDSENQ